MAIIVTGIKQDHLKMGQTLHLKIKDMILVEDLIYVDDVTPLPGAKVLYICKQCGLGMEAEDDGSLPEGFLIKPYLGGTIVICGSEQCQSSPVCRICGCTQERAYEGGCHWVENDLCSACVEKGKASGGC
ncbi:MAG: hypothetical protein WC551_08330 [Patescibacteria group bacterium]